MLFNSIHYLIFFPIVAGAYFILPQRYRWMLVLASSYYFYMCWRVEYVFLIVISTLVDYWAGLYIGSHHHSGKRKAALFLSLFCNLGLLFVFKYLDFFGHSLNMVSGSFNIFFHMPDLKFLLPVGISFYTFQSLSYTIDIYNNKRKPERHLGIFASYVAFFPQLVAGPIERSTHLIPQFFIKHRFDYARVTSGLKLMAWGFFKKLVIADRLAIYVNQVFNNPYEYQGQAVLLAVYFFAFQIYCDFSGYTDIAIGSARVMGFELMKNFNCPYYAKSISDFWRRWHISLSSWFRDYLYIPLGGNRVGRGRWYFNLMIVFCLSGLWHGANWTFALWGALHGFYFIFGDLSCGFRRKLAQKVGLARFPRLYGFLQTCTTFHLVCFGWIFFRANSVKEALVLLRNLFRFDLGGLNINVALGREGLIVAIVSIGLLELVHGLQQRYGLSALLGRQHGVVRWAAYYLLLMTVLLFGQFGSQEFIYFRF